MADSSHDAPIALNQASIKAIDSLSVHRITSGQVVIDLQTAVKELVENSLDAAATNIDVRFINYGLKSIEVVDNGSGIAPKDYESVALKHHTSKLAAFEDLSTVLTFGFRGEALSSLCALSDGVTLTTATANEAPMGTILEMDRNGRLVNSSSKVARQRGTTVTVSSIFKPLPVRRKELERNVKREFGKALNLLHAYALVPCANENRGVRLAVSNQPEGGRKTVHLKTDGTPSVKASVTALWGTKALDNVVDLALSFDVPMEKSVLRRLDQESASATPVKVRGLISKFTVGAGRTGSDRQHFFVNGRPCNLGKIQKAFNEVYKSFSAGQFPFIIADFIVPTHTCDINVSPDKRAIFLHNEQNLIQALKTALEETFAPSRSTFDVDARSSQQPTLHLSFTPKTSLSQTDGPKAARHSAHKAETDLNQDPPTERIQDDNLVTITPRLHSSPEVAPRSCNQLGQIRSESFLEQPDITGRGRPLFLPDSEVEGGGDINQVNHPDEVDELRGGEQEVVEPTREQVNTRRALNQLRRSVDQVPQASRPDELDGSGEEEQEDRPIHVQVVSATDRIHALRALRQTRKRSANYQITLSTKDASWNHGELRDGDDHDHDGPRKRLRLAERDGRTSLRRTLSQFARTGNEVPKTSGDQFEDRNPFEETDSTEELIGDDEATNVLPRVGTESMSSRARNRSEETLALPDDEDAMDIEISESLRPPVHLGEHPPTPQDLVINEDVSDTINLTDDDLSVTIVNTDMNSSISKDRLGPIVLCCDLDKICHAWIHLGRAKSATSELSSADSQIRDTLDAANVENAEDNATASAALSRIISKADFTKMQVIGQFNLGFIIARRQKSEEGLDDLFIIDQHAADEKYNFETLQQTTVIESQRLFRPERLELTAADEILAVENMDILKQNGFEVVRQLDDDEEGRLLLVAQPVSKGTVFDVKDLQELIHLMHDRPVGTMVRCSKARAMFAMRACRKSVMIGKALSVVKMSSIIQHMSTMDQPWNCPHGRPTMRHVSDLTCFARYNPLPRPVDWTTFGAANPIS